MVKRIMRFKTAVISIIVVLISSFFTVFGLFSGRTVFGASDKIPLTQDFLKQEYSRHYQGNNPAMMLIIIVPVIIIHLVASGICIFAFLKTKKAEPDNKIKRWLWLIPVLISTPGVLLFTSFVIMGAASTPAPDNAEYRVKEIYVIRTDAETTTDPDNNFDHTSYYIYIKDDNHGSGERRIRVSVALYTSVSGSGEYYLASARSGIRNENFAIYSPDSYELVD